MNRKNPRYKDGRTGHKLYNLWHGMMNRVRNVDKWSYKNVNVYKEWEDDPFSFYRWCEKNGYKKGLELDRIDTNGDYTPENCRFVTRRINGINRNKQINNTSGYIGVHFASRKNKWCAQIKANSKVLFLGYFDSPRMAACRRDVEAIKIGYPTNF